MQQGRFPRPLAQRFPANLADLAERVAQLLQRTLVLEDGCNVVNYPATISATYTSGQPTVVMPDGSTAGPFPCLNSYTPHAGDHVLLLPLGQSYVVAGTYS